MSRDPGPDGLNDRQRKFIDEYSLDLNATNAAIRAGYAKRSARQIGSTLLLNPIVSKALDGVLQKRSRATKIDAAWVLKRLAAEAEADVADLYNEAGGLKPIREWPEIWRRGLVAGLDVSQSTGPDGSTCGEVVKVRLSDRVKRLELIGKHIGVNAFQEVVQHKGLEGLADRLDRAARREAGE